MPAGNRAGRTRACGGSDGDAVALLFQDPDGPRDLGIPVPPELARARVVDQDGVPVGCDGGFSGFLVKL